MINFDNLKPHDVSFVSESEMQAKFRLEHLRSSFRKWLEEQYESHVSGRPIADECKIFPLHGEVFIELKVRGEQMVGFNSPYIRLGREDEVTKGIIRVSDDVSAGVHDEALLASAHLWEKRKKQNDTAAAGGPGAEAGSWS